MFLPICFSSVYLCIFKTYSIALSFLSWCCDIFHLLVYFPFIMFPYFLDILDTGDWEQPTLFCIISLSDWSGKNVIDLKNNWPVLHEFHEARIFSNQTKVVFISYLWSVYVLQSKKLKSGDAKRFSRSCRCKTLVTYFDRFVLYGQDTAFLKLIIFHALSDSDTPNTSKVIRKEKWWLQKRNSIRLDIHDVLSAKCEAVTCTTGGGHHRMLSTWLHVDFNMCGFIARQRDPGGVFMFKRMESIMNNQRCNHQINLWSFGITHYSMTGEKKMFSVLFKTPFNLYKV